MKPVKLILQAFGPYAQREEIDFRNLTEAGLFGVYGPTGSGKTTIFSAISFALYGEPARKDQQVSTLRSDHASAHTITKVEYIFELNSRRYRIVREPDQEKPRQRGEGSTTSSQKAWLFDVTDLEIDHITSENTGEVIAEKKVSLVKEKVLELIGYGPEQFKQIVLLPQGKFETFLSANTDNRVAILRDLFDVSLFKNFTEKLKEDAADAERRVTEKLKLSDQQLRDNGFESLEDLETGIIEAEEKSEHSKVELGTAKIHHQEVTQELQNAQTLNDQFKELNELKNSKKELDDRSDDLTPKRELLRSIENAQKLLPFRDKFNEATNNLSTETSNFDESQTKFIAAYKNLEAAKKEEHCAGKAASELLEIRKQISNFKNYKEKVEQSTNLIDELKKLQEDTEEFKEIAEKADSVYRETNQNVKSLEDRIQQLKLDREKAVKLEKSLLELKQTAKSIEDFQAVKSALDDAKKICAVKINSSKAIKLEFDEKNDEFEAAELALSDMQAVHLASKLTSNKACPVCGSKSHPNPATGKKLVLA